MANRIRLDDGDDFSLDVTMSNGLTAVVTDVLTLSGSDLAETDWQRSLVVFIAGHDQGVYGFGTQGFRLDEIGWSADDFAAQQAFLVKIIEQAAAGHRWGALNYEPRRDWVLTSLAGLHHLAGLVPAPTHDLAWDRPEVIDTMRSRGWPRCDRHRVLLHVDGCHLCNNAAL